MTDIPHFALPFRFDAAAGPHGPAAVVLEQDTADEIMACMTAVVLCPRGFRAESPDFGIEDPTFSQGMVDAEPIGEAIAEWEPRALSTATTRGDAVDELLDYVLVSLGVPSGG